MTRFMMGILARGGGLPGGCWVPALLTGLIGPGLAEVAG